MPVLRERNLYVSPSRNILEVSAVEHVPTASSSHVRKRSQIEKKIAVGKSSRSRLVLVYPSTATSRYERRATSEYDLPSSSSESRLVLRSATASNSDLRNTNGRAGSRLPSAKVLSWLFREVVRLLRVTEQPARLRCMSVQRVVITDNALQSVVRIQSRIIQSTVIRLYDSTAISSEIHSPYLS